MNMVISGVVVFDNGDIVAIIDGQAGFFESEAIDSGTAARGEEGSIGLQGFAALHRQAYTTGGIFGFDRAFVKQETHAKSGEAVAKTIGNLVIQKWEKTIAPVTEGDVNPERLKDGGILAANDAAADDRQAFGDAVHLNKGVGVKSVQVVEGNLWRARRLGAGGNEDDFSL